MVQKALALTGSAARPVGVVLVPAVVCFVFGDWPEAGLMAILLAVSSRLAAVGHVGMLLVWLAFWVPAGPRPAFPDEWGLSAHAAGTALTLPRKAAPKAQPALLEPIMSLEVVTPEEYMGDIIGDINKRRGQVNDMDTKGNARIIKAKVPLAEQFGYITTLRTLSSGRATSSMEFFQFEELPANLAREVMEKTGWAKGFHASSVEF